MSDGADEGIDEVTDGNKAFANASDAKTVNTKDNSNTNSNTNANTNSNADNAYTTPHTSYLNISQILPHSLTVSWQRPCSPESGSSNSSGGVGGGGGGGVGIGD